MQKTRVTVCIGLSIEELAERFGASLDAWRSEAKTRDTKAGLAIQCDAFDRLGVDGCLSLAATLRLPVRWVAHKDAL
jgi:hypothetical protein